MYSKEHNEPCQMDPIEETHVTMTFRCPLGRLDKDEFINLDVIMTVIPNTLGEPNTIHCRAWTTSKTRRLMALISTHGKRHKAYIE